jgi:hypothetical protein
VTSRAGPPPAGRPGAEPPAPPAAPSGNPRFGAWSEAARDTLEVVVGLGVMGLMRARAEAPRLEAELTRRGLEPLAAVTHTAGEVVDEVVRQLLQPPAPPSPGG